MLLFGVGAYIIRPRAYDIRPYKRYIVIPVRNSDTYEQ